MSSDFKISVPINASAERVYKAVGSSEGPAGWWTKFCRVGSQEGDEAEFRFPAAGFFAKFRIARLEPPRLVEWECIDCLHPEQTGWSDLREWTGTTVRFEIEAVTEEVSRLRFTHVGLNDRLECNDTCRTTWAMYVGESLRGLVEHGEGRPYTDDSVDRIGQP